MSAPFPLYECTPTRSVVYGVAQLSRDRLEEDLERLSEADLDGLLGLLTEGPRRLLQHDVLLYECTPTRSVVYGVAQTGGGRIKSALSRLSEADLDGLLGLLTEEPQMTTATRRLEFDAAHRVLGHGGKCKYLHGHRYVVEVTVQSEELNSLGMVVDFSCIKEKVGKWIDEELDHNVLLHKDDPLLLGYFYTDDETTPTGIDREPFVMRCNPTAENIAQMIYDKAYELLESYRARVIRVRVFETPNCWADYPG